MAVVFKTLSGPELLSALGLNSLKGSLATVGVTVVVTPKATKFVKDGEVLSAASVSSAAVKAAISGTLDGATMADLKAVIYDAGGKAYKYAKEGKVPEAKAEGPKAFEAVKAAPIPAIDAPAPVWDVFDLSKLNSAPQVKLRDATKMYQPVLGSSSGSRYFMVAANEDLRIAARYKGQNLSVRIEGPKFDAYFEQIAECGFTNVNKAKGYASMHLEVPNQVTAAKALGAVLLGLGVKLETPIPDLGVIKGKGS